MLLHLFFFVFVLALVSCDSPSGNVPYVSPLLMPAVSLSFTPLNTIPAYLPSSGSFPLTLSLSQFDTSPSSLTLFAAVTDVATQSTIYVTTVQQQTVPAATTAPTQTNVAMTVTLSTTLSTTSSYLLIVYAVATANLPSSVTFQSSYALACTSLVVPVSVALTFNALPVSVQAATATANSNCVDVPPPPATYTCAQQVAWGKCGQSFMVGYCQLSCGTCSVAPPPPPTSSSSSSSVLSSCNSSPPAPATFTCDQQAQWGKCTQPWMNGYCQTQCGTCQLPTAAPCTDVAPPGSSYSCQQQLLWGKCTQPWMSGYCLCSCSSSSASTSSSPSQLPSSSSPSTSASTTAAATTATITTTAPQTTPPARCIDVPPGGGYTCAQQAGWGKCTASFMTGFCLVTCGTCPSSPSPSPAPSSPSSSPPTSPPSISGSARVAVAGLQLTLNGAPLFLLGVNQAWVNYGNDFSGASLSQIQATIQQVRATGGNSIRLWAHCSGDSSPLWNSDGTVSGLPSTFIPSLLSILAYAKSMNVLVDLALWNFMITTNHAALYTNVNVLQSYINNALIPIVQAVAASPSASALLAYEISNEPEGASIEFGWQSNKVSMAQIQSAVNAQAHAIHVADPRALVTVGSWSWKAATDNFGNVNYYSDARLIASNAGQYPLGTVDFVQVHYYSWMGRGSLSSVDNPPSAYGLSKPIIVGEFSQSGSVNLTIQDLYMRVHDLGYAGAWGWQANGSGAAADPLSLLLAGIASVFTTRPQQLNVDLNNGVPPLQVATPMPTSTNPNGNLNGEAATHAGLTPLSFIFVLAALCALFNARAL